MRERDGFLVGAVLPVVVMAFAVMLFEVFDRGPWPTWKLVVMAVSACVWGAVGIRAARFAWDT